MAALVHGPGLRVLIRSLAIQASWNYRTMQGAGLAFALVPVLARLAGGDREALAAAVGRHAGFYNGHPYLSTVAIGALARMESDGVESAQIEQFKNAIVGPLGGLGDRLVWARWRPMCALIAILAFSLGAPWWVAVGAFLVLYNAVQLGLRVWGLQFGWRHGREVGRALLASPLRRIPDRITIPLVFAGGAVVPPLALEAGGAVGPLPAVSIALAVAAIGYWRPGVSARLAALGLLAGSLVIVALSMSVG